MRICPKGLPLALKIREVTPMTDACQRNILFSVKQEKSPQNQGDGYAPKYPLTFGKITNQGFQSAQHSNLLNNKKINIRVPIF